MGPDIKIMLTGKGFLYFLLILLTLCAGLGLIWLILGGMAALGAGILLLLAWKGALSLLKV